MPEEQKTNGDRLREFHLTMDGRIMPKPGVPDVETLLVRRTLIDEEYAEVAAVFNELFSALQRGEPVDIAPLMHELVDLLYVTYGTMWACGVNPDPVFAEVHRANMQKASGPRRADGKVLKPDNWQPPDVRGVIARQKQKER